MAVSHGYSKITTSGSVFAYDTGDVVNSWKGKPGTNVSYGIVNLQGTNTGQYFKTSYGNEVDNIPGLGGNTTVRYIDIFNNYPSSSACCVQLFAYASDTPISGSTTYTYQLVYKTLGGENSNFLYRYEYNAAGAYVTEGGVWSASNIQDLGNGWSHAWGQFTTNASTTKIYLYTFYYEYNTWRHIQVAGVSLTQGTTIYPPRQFIPTASSRALTEGLLDISKVNNSITLTNMSYDSNGMLYFDGTDDYQVTNNMPAMSNWTAEAVINLSSYTTAQKVILDVNVGIRLEISNGKFNSHFGNGTGWVYTVMPSSFTYTANRYYHVVITVQSGGWATMYINGVIDNAMSIGSGTTPAIPMYIGRYTPGGYEIAAYLPVVRIYDRALTQGEVTDNFNHYKTRFNIT